MKYLFQLLIFFIFMFGNSFSQTDSVFIKKKEYNELDSLVWVMIDTNYFPSTLQRNILLGTCILPWTHG